MITMYKKFYLLIALMLPSMYSNAGESLYEPLHGPIPAPHPVMIPSVGIVKRLTPALISTFSLMLSQTAAVSTIYSAISAKSGLPNTFYKVESVASTILNSAAAATVIYKAKKGGKPLFAGLRDIFGKARWHYAIRSTTLLFGQAAACAHFVEWGTGRELTSTNFYLADAALTTLLNCAGVMSFIYEYYRSPVLNGVVVGRDDDLP